MKKAVLFLLFVLTALQMSADEGHGFIQVRLNNGQVDSIAVDGIYNITHSKYDLVGIEHPDFVTTIVKTDDMERKYLIVDIDKIVLPMETITIGNSFIQTSNGPRKIIFEGTFPPKDYSDPVVYKWQPDDHVYIHMNNQDTVYAAEKDSMKRDSTWMWFKPIEVKKKEEPIYIYYPGENAKAYNKVTIARTQEQTKVNNTEHIRYSGDCGADEGVPVPNMPGHYTFNILHHPAFLAFVLHNPRLPSVKLKSVTMIADQPIAGTFEFDDKEIKLNTIEDGSDTITLKTPYFYDKLGWKHTPRELEHAQDSTAAYMVVAPQEGKDGGYLNLSFTFNVEDTLSLIDTVFVKKFRIKKIKPNTFYTFDIEVPDTLFSIVDMGIGDIKFAFRNVEAYFERGPVSNYGGAFSYGESNTKNNYEGGTWQSNWGGSTINDEFVDKYDAAYQRWRGCWRMPQISEIDSLLKYCKQEWWEYNGVEGVLFTSNITGKRIFLPASDLTGRYWAVNREWTADSLYRNYNNYGSFSTTYFNKPVLTLIKKGTPPAAYGQSKMYEPGYARGVLEYSNDIRSNTSFDGSLMLMRHLGEYEEDKKNFAITGMIRSVRPWPKKGTNPTLNETGFIFGTDSATLYFDEADAAHNKTWVPADSMFMKDPAGENRWLPMYQDGSYNHLKLVDGGKSISAYGGTPDGPADAQIKVSLSGDQFLGYLDKHQKYYVREYFMVKNPVTGKNDYYYATKATPIKGFFPHTDKIRWKVGEDNATFNAHVVGVSTEVVGHVGFILSDSIITYPNSTTVDYALPTLATGKLYLSDQASRDGKDELGSLNDDMTYSLTIGKGSKQNIPFENKYYFARAVFVSFSEDENGKKDTTCVYAPDDEVYIVHPLDTIDLGLPSGLLYANLCIDAQFPEDENSGRYRWNTADPKTDPFNWLISDISGTVYDETFRDWFGREGWTFAMPSNEEMKELLEFCSFDYVKRFGRNVIRVSGPNSAEVDGDGNVLYLPAEFSCYDGSSTSYHALDWTSTRPMKDTKQAYWGMCNKGWHGNRLMSMTSQLRIRPVMQVIGGTKADEPIFVSTDTIGNDQVNPENISFWGRELGVTAEMKGKYTSIVRGFLVDEVKYFEFNKDEAHPTPAINLPDATKKEDIYNGLYSVGFPLDQIETIDADKDYWYRAYMVIDGEYFYGVPKKLPTTEIHMKHRDWEVHANKATLYSRLDGMVYVKKKTEARTGFLIGKTPDIEMAKDLNDATYPRKVYANEASYGKDTDGHLKIQDGEYYQTISVPKDTIYWVRAFLEADGKVRLSEAKQFGLDYVDLGLPSKVLWANINVGSGYPEDSCDYYCPAEAFIKAQPTDYAHYSAGTYSDCYIDDVILKGVIVDKQEYQSTDSVMLKKLTVSNNKGEETYQMDWRGAVHDTYGNCNPDGTRWIHYSGTKNDAAFMNWEYQNPKFGNTEKYNRNTYVYDENTGYGNLFVEPNFDEWKELEEKCTWELTVEDGINGHRVTGPNGNSIFLPLRGYRNSSVASAKGGEVQWNDYWSGDLEVAHYHIADTTFFKSISIPGNYGGGDYGNGQSVRAVARYNMPLTNNHDNLRDETLVYLSTDTATYLNERTVVVLGGTYRINWPIDPAKYELGFVVGNNENIKVGQDATINAQILTRNGSQYFVALDKNSTFSDHSKINGDQTYYYRFYLHLKDGLPYINGEPYRYADADTFHLARMATGDVEYEIYGTQATMHGHVQGIMDHEATGGVKAGILLSYDRDNLTVETAEVSDATHLFKNIDLTSDLKSYGKKNGPISYTYTIPGTAPDTTYYFRAYATYDGKTHYGDINVWGYEMVDLGLTSGRKWASINVGSPNSLEGIKTGYITNERYSVNENGVEGRIFRKSGPGGPEDPAHMKWVNVSRMPYQKEIEELISECEWKADTIHGYAGITVTGPNGKTIFFRNIRSLYHMNPTNAHYTVQSNYMRLPESNDPLASHKGHFNYYQNGEKGCDFRNFLRPVWESNIHLDNTNKDELLIRTDDALIHMPSMQNVTFFGSLLGVTQRRRGMETTYQVPELSHAGFIVGVDTLVAHKDDSYNENSKYFKYDFPKKDSNGNYTVTTDSIYYYETANINFFKVDTAYWVRAYVQIGDKYYYGRSFKFVRSPNVITGDVEWMVGEQKATLHGEVVGFNKDIVLSGLNAESDELKDMDEVAKSAEVGIVVGYKHGIDEKSPSTEIYKWYPLGNVWDGNTKFSVTVDYPKDTTYYYRAYIKYNDKYKFGETGRYGLEFIDLGLPMMWASINVGSRFAEDDSWKFSWGDTETQSTYKFTDYRYYYATGDDEYNNLGNEIKGTQHDVAHVRWDYTWDVAEYGGRGQLWAMPSEEDLQMLADSCQWTDSISKKFVPSTNSYEDVKGFRVYSPKTGRNIFIASTQTAEWNMKGEHFDSGSRNGPWDYGPLWTSSRAPRERNAFGMEVGAKNNKDAKQLMKYHYRYHGHFVRPMARINVTLPSHNNKKLSITTERTSWTAGASTATIYGCVLGLTSDVKGTYGFLVGNDKDKLEVGKSGVEQNLVCGSNSDVNGLFQQTLSSLDNHRMYYFRAYLQIDGKYYYDDVKEFGIIEVDLGLPSGTKWANVNLGSWKAKDHGDFYSWGETATKDIFSLGGYKYYDGLTNSYRELSTNISGNDTTDVASKTLGGLWRMAGDEEWEELMRECTWTKDTVAHVPGYRVTSKKSGNTNSIFLPTNYYDAMNRDANYELETNEEGYKNHDYEQTSYGYYWSSNRSTDYTKAREMQFSTDIQNIPTMVTDNYRYRGNAIRAVVHPNNGDYYIRTEDTDWRYQKDSINFYAIGLTPENISWGTSYEGKDFEVGILVSKSSSPTLQDGGTLTGDGTFKLMAKPTNTGGHDFVATLDDEYVQALTAEARETLELDDKLSKYHDGVFYYRAFLIDKLNGNKVYMAPVTKQFGLQRISMGDGLVWANINVDAASPEQIGLNGVPAGKYAGVDPAYAEFGGSWRVPTEAEKQTLLDDAKYTWTNVDETNKPLELYGVQVWKVVSKDNPSNFIYLTSKDPSAWGFRAVAQVNITVPEVGTAYLRTDSTNWRAGYGGNNLYASLVGDKVLLDGITERGFVLSTTEGSKPADDTLPSAFTLHYTTDSEIPEQVTASNFYATIPALPVGTYYYRAYVKYGDGRYYYADEALPVGIEFIDLGLPSGVRWANVNIGATVETDAGDRYAWGETEVKETYTINNYQHYSSVTGYKDIGADISSNAQYDAAASKIDGTRMPTSTELDELIANCEWEPETLNGVSGFRVTSKKPGNTNSIFLPAGAIYTYDEFGRVTSTSYPGYWTSTQVAANNSNAYRLAETNTAKSRTTNIRYAGLMIRPVSASITTTDATEVTKTSAVINGICSTTSDNRTAVGFEWTAASNPAAADWKTVDATFNTGTNGAMHHELTGLTEGNIYYYRAYVQMKGEAARKYGTTKYFTTTSTEGNRPQHINLGLASEVEWGDRNVDANLPELDGEFYAWGDTLTRLNYNKRIYSHFDVETNKYKSIGNNFSASENDIATRKFEGCWRMPTEAEMRELMTSCTWTWATKEGQQGYWVESNVNHNKIFLPAAGFRESIDRKHNDVMGFYWTASMPGNPTDSYGYGLHFHSSAKDIRTSGSLGTYSYNSLERYVGFTIRPVYQTNAKFGDQDVFIRTDSISYKADYTENTLYGTMLGLEEDETDLSQGFVIGTTTDVSASNTVISIEKLTQAATANGSFHMTLDETDLKSLLVGEAYYVRAFVKKGDEYRYGNALELADYTFFTDSVKWGLGNSATLYAHVKATKPASGLEVGFFYSTDDKTLEAGGRLKNGSKLVGGFGTGDKADVFTSSLSQVQVHTYYYQAYTYYDNVYHYGEVKSFGAKVVDLGLTSGIKWVDMNLGADNEEGEGDTYRWGDVEPNSTETSVVPAGQTYIGGTTYDAATSRLGSTYRLPSIDNINELLDECTWSPEVTGYRITSKKNGNSIFLPLGDYWTSLRGTGSAEQATKLLTDSSNTHTTALDLRTAALKLRATLNPKSDMQGEGGNAGGGEIGGGVGGNE